MVGNDDDTTELVCRSLRLSRQLVVLSNAVTPFALRNCSMNRAISPLLSPDAQSCTISVHALEDGLRPTATLVRYNYSSVFSLLAMLPASPTILPFCRAVTLIKTSFQFCSSWRTAISLRLGLLLYTRQPLHRTDQLQALLMAKTRNRKLDHRRTMSQGTGAPSFKVDNLLLKN